MRWWGWIIVILLTIWIIHHPVQASADVHSIGNFFSGVAGG